MKLFGYWRSSATYRVRIAAALKGLSFDYQPIDIVNGEQHQSAYEKINPQKLVPALVTGNGETLTQALAIIEYLEEQFPDRPLLPTDPVQRAHARAVAIAITSEAQPMMNSGVQKFLRTEFDFDDGKIDMWLQGRVGRTMAAVESMIKGWPGAFAMSDEPGYVDCFIVPQCYGAQRFEIDLDAFPTMKAIFDHSGSHPAFQQAHPKNQPDAPEA